MGIRPGWGMTTTGGLCIEMHSLFTRARRWSLPSPQGLGPAARLGRAAAGAGRALRAADAVGCAAVFRGRRGGGHLLPSCCLPCGEGGQGTKKDACYVCASLTRTFPRLQVLSAVSLAMGGSEETRPYGDSCLVCWCFLFVFKASCTARRGRFSS